MNVVLAGPAAFRGRGDIHAGRGPAAGDDDGGRRASRVAGTKHLSTGRKTWVRRNGSKRSSSAVARAASCANVAYVARHAAEFGTTTGRVAIDMVTVRWRKRDMVDGQIAGHLRHYKDSGAELIMGSGRFVAPKTLEVRLNGSGTRVLAADQIFLNLGTQATIPDVPGLKAATPLTNIEALELDRVPPHLIVLGGGYVGLEFSQAYVASAAA